MAGLRQRPQRYPISRDYRFATTQHVDALKRVGTLTNDITQAHNLINTKRLNLAQHCCQCFQVAMDIANDRLHDCGFVLRRKTSNVPKPSDLTARAVAER